MDGITRYFNETPMSYTDELMHYGVLGMKWGKRKTKESASISKKQKRRILSKEERLKIKGERMVKDAIRKANKANIKADINYKIDKGKLYINIDEDTFRV